VDLAYYWQQMLPTKFFADDVAKISVLASNVSDIVGLILSADKAGKCEQTVKLPAAE